MIFVGSFGSELTAHVMKILIFAPYFPPYNAIGSIRAANFVQYLLSQNVDVRVISAAHSELDQSQYSPISSDKVIFVKWSDSNPQYQLQRHANIELGKTIQKKPGFFAFLRVILRSLLYWPDRHQFWVTPACKEANRMLEDWKPNLIFASAFNGMKPKFFVCTNDSIRIISSNCRRKSQAVTKS